MTIANKLAFLAGTKTALREAINAAGGNLSTATPFRQYTGLMQEMSATLDLQFWCERFITRRRGSMAPHAVGFSNIVTFTRSTGGGVTNEFGQFVWRAINEWRNDHDPGSLTTSTSTASFEASTASFVLPEGHAFFVGDLFRATAVGGSIWGIVTARSATSVTIYVRNSTGTGGASSWTCIRPLGLLVEEQRTRLNTISIGPGLLTPSGASYIEDGTVFIDGVTPFKKIVEGTSTGAHFGQPSTVALSASTTYTAQYFIKSAGRSKIRLLAQSAGSWAVANPTVTYDLVAMTVLGANGASGKVTRLAGDVFRITWTATTGASSFSGGVYPVLLDGQGNQSYTGDGESGAYISGYQIEVGTFATSLIYGEGAQVTRAAGVCSVNTLSPWYNASEGTLFVEASAIGVPPGAGTSASFTDGTPNNRIIVGQFFTTTRIGTVGVATVDQAIFPVPSVSLNQPHKFALAWAANNFAASVDGGSPLTDSNGSIPTVTVLNIGALNTIERFSGHIRSLRYFPRRLTNSELQELTV